MAIEIERKFLVKGEQWRNLGKGKIYRQGYFPTAQGCTIRVRIIGNEGYLTIKGKTVGNSRAEFEYPIPLSDAQEMLNNLCDRPLIEKTRYKITQDNLIWEVDEFMGENEGLIIAEVELKTEDQKINIPEWIGKEVSGEAKYYNANLVKFPFCQWEK
jgi:CYTH domain-containing protein